MALAGAPPVPGRLAEAALWIAAEEYPDLDVPGALQRVASLGRRAASRIPPGATASGVAAALRAVLAEDAGFRGNDDDYYDPRNSFLNEVLDRRLGIPITLSILYMEAGAHAGVTVHGVGLPGHFVVAVERDGHRRLLDPFHGGRDLDSADCAALVARGVGPGARLRPEHLAPVSTRQILVRMLTNLKAVYGRRGDLRRALAAVDRILLLSPDAIGERRDRGVLLVRTGEPLAAIRDFEAYLVHKPTPADAPEVLRQLRALRQAMARLN